MSGTATTIVVIVLARDIEDFERIHRTELSRLPRIARLESSFALREVVNRAVPPSVFVQAQPRRAAQALTSASASRRGVDAEGDAAQHDGDAGKPHAVQRLAGQDARRSRARRRAPAARLGPTLAAG